MAVLATVMHLRSDTDLSLCGVPKRMATDLDWLRTMPLSQNQACRIWYSYQATEPHTVACRLRIAADRLCAPDSELLFIEMGTLKFYD